MAVLEGTVRARLLLPLALGLATALAPTRGEAQQDSPEEAYLRATAQHFRVPVEEVRILAEWDLPTVEMPVVLHLARRAGVSPDAIVTLRRGGSSWGELATRYGVSVETFHVPLPDDAATGALERAYRAFGDTPRSSWDRIRLTDSEVVALVNLAFLSQRLDVPHRVVLEAAGAGSDFVRAHRTLTARGGT